MTDTSATAGAAGDPSDISRRAARPPSGEELGALRRRTTAVLVLSQILGGLGVATGIALAAVLAEEVGGSKALAGLAVTSSVLGTAVLSLPFAALTAARGRRAGLAAGYLVGAAGGVLVVLASVAGSFPLLLLGTAVFGAGSSANLQARFAAADLAEPAHRGRAISTVVWATTIGAVLGPNIAAPAGRSTAGLGIPEAAGPFLWGAAVFLLAAVLVLALLRPDPLLTARALTAADPAAGPEAGGRSLRAGAAAVAASPHARLALAAVACSHTAMVSIMVMTPVDLGHHGADIELIGLVISLHITGMYAFSPLVGRLCDRLGRLPVISLGVALLAGAALTAGTADGDHVQTTAGLFLLGLGWSAGLVGGSTLLTDSVPQSSRASVQGLSDLVMNAAAGAGGALAGVVVAQAGYGWLNAMGAAVLLPVVALALSARVTRRPGPDGG